MPTFHYVAKRGPQDVVEGALEADNRAAALNRLTELGYLPVRIQEAAAGEASRARAAAARDGRVPRYHLNLFTRQFASLVRSQVPLLRALDILLEQTAHPRLRRIIQGIADDIRHGDTFSQALAKYPQVFSRLYVNLAQSGEVAGILDTVLDRLVAEADREEALRANIQAALVYPLFVGAVGLGTVAFLLTFVMPRMVRLFEGFGGQLPLPTRWLLTMSLWCRQWWFWALTAAVMAVVVGVLKDRRQQTRLVLDRLALRLPLIGPLVRQLELSRFARSFGLLLNHGVPILQATEVAVPVIHNLVAQQALARLPARLREGTSLAAGLKEVAVITPFVLHTVAVGEEGGRVGEALIEIANYYEREVERQLHVLASLLEPAMVLLVGAVVGFIVMAVLLPVFELSIIAR